ncbi:MAG: peptide chain release factor N(5)-glutamine methyltransferase, partial [Phycisphaerae bacterium]
ARTTFRELVQRAAEHEPIAYLVGKKEFFSLDFEVDKSVLIPRAETETLIEVACDQLKADELESPSLLDIGTGSGCIAITMLKQMSQATMIATDISADALAVAARNADKHDVSDRLTLMETDGMQGLPADQRFDAVLSNPPYISRDEHEQLDASVRDFEPRCALTDDADGLSFYEKIAGQAASWLSPQGFVAVEIGFGQTDPVTSIFLEHGPWAHKGTWKDRVEGHDRVLMFTTASP